jgi:hypothetical protein
MPATVEWRGSGNRVAVALPSTNACTFSTETFSSLAMNARIRDGQSTPAMPP